MITDTAKPPIWRAMTLGETGHKSAERTTRKEYRLGLPPSHVTLSAKAVNVLLFFFPRILELRKNGAKNGKNRTDHD